MKTLTIKPTLLFFFLAILLHNTYGQKRYPHPTRDEFMKGKVMVGSTIIDTANSTPGQMALYRKSVRLNELVKEHYYFNWLGKQDLGVRFSLGSKIYEGLKQPNNGREFTSVLIDGTTPVEIVDQYIDSKEKAENYLYRVIRNNNQELMGWTKPSNIKASANGSVKYAYLGKFDYSPGTFLKVEIYNVKKFSEQDAVFIDWRPVVAPKVDGYIQYLSSHFRLPDDGLDSRNIKNLQYTTEKYFKMIDGRGVIIDRPVTVKDFVETTDKNDIRFRADDSVKNLSFDFGKTDIIYTYKVSLKRTVNGKTDSINMGENNSIFNLYKEFWKEAGKYKITFTPKIYKSGGNPVKLLRDKATSISFTVLPALNQESTVSLKFFLLILVIIISTVAYSFVMYRESQKRKLNKAAQNKQIATLQLQAVRSQLNPHFIFNALAGIQNLMNKNEVENANKYLSKFAKITRNVLDNSSKELTPIEHETELLNDYLLMEQMRFGFQFSIEVDPNEIDQQIEIPAMLLQPFVENAVKHGVSTLKGAGIIKVIITKTGNTLLLAVRDNGKGFVDKSTNGMGIKLCRERITLLNSIYKNSHVELRQLTDNKGTLITIELQNWI